MVAKPSSLPVWATTGGTVVEPSAGQKALGWVRGTRPPARWMNWLFNTLYNWTAYQDERSIKMQLGNYRTATSGFTTDPVYGFGWSSALSMAVAVGLNGKLSTSVDFGRNWTSRTSGAGTDTLTGALYGALWIAFGANAKLSSSPDGVTWTARTSGFTASQIFAGLYNAGLYIIAGASGKVSTSTNGTSWTSRTANAGTDTLAQILYAASLSLYAVVSNATHFCTSPDGTTWTSRTIGLTAGDTIAHCVFANGVFVLVQADAHFTGTTKIWSSPDGTTWTSHNVVVGLGGAGPTRSFQTVAYVPETGLFVAVGDDGILATSPDGLTWTLQTNIPIVTNQTVTQLVTLNGGLAALVLEVGGSALTDFVWISVDGINWTKFSVDFNGDAPNIIVPADRMLLVGGDNAKVAHSLLA